MNCRSEIASASKFLYDLMKGLSMNSDIENAVCEAVESEAVNYADVVKLALDIGEHMLKHRRKNKKDRSEIYNYRKAITPVFVTLNRGKDTGL